MSKRLPFATTLKVKDTCLCLHIQRAARVLGRRFDEALRPTGLTNGQFSLLMALNRPQPPAIAPVAQLLAMDRTTLTAVLKPLKRNGLVSITVDSNDRRSRLLTLTAKGHRKLVAAVPIWRKVHASIETELKTLSPNELRAGLLTLS